MESTLFTPWRLSYIRREPSSDPACFLCAAVAAPEEPEHLVVAAGEEHLVILNRHPYSAGHLMVAPRAHLGDPGAAGEAARGELWPLVLSCCDVLREAYRPDGLNLGLNLGHAAGAGEPDHYHFHVVPRWEGDSNFLAVVAGTRLVPEDPAQTRERLRPLFAARGLV